MHILKKENLGINNLRSENFTPRLDSLINAQQILDLLVPLSFKRSCSVKYDSADLGTSG